MEDLYAALGYGKFSARQVLQKLVPSLVPPPEPETPEPSARRPYARPRPPSMGADKDLVVKVKGVDDLLIYRAKCCNPIRGEAIVGYVTRGRASRCIPQNCTNVQNLMYEVERKIDVEWSAERQKRSR